MALGWVMECEALAAVLFLTADEEAHVSIIMAMLWDAAAWLGMPHLDFIQSCNLVPLVRSGWG